MLKDGIISILELKISNGVRTKIDIWKEYEGELPEDLGLSKWFDKHGLSCFRCGTTEMKDFTKIMQVCMRMSYEKPIKTFVGIRIGLVDLPQETNSFYRGNLHILLSSNPNKKIKMLTSVWGKGMKLDETKAFPHGMKIQSFRHYLWEITLEGHENGINTLQLSSREIMCLHVVWLFICNKVDLDRKSIADSVNKATQWHDIKVKKCMLDVHG